MTDYNKSSKYYWTCDVETDFGGRTNGTLGIRYGLPKILELFRIYKVKGIFFISTELIRNHKDIVEEIAREGHTIGSHGHFHKVWKEKWRAWDDKQLSEELLSKYTKGHILYRAPKFSFRTDCVYSNPSNHVGLLKHSWFGGKINDDTIFYLHPFDIVHWDKAPNLFCALWYSRPNTALRTLKRLLCEYA